MLPCTRQLDFPYYFTVRCTTKYTAIWLLRRINVCRCLLLVCLLVRLFSPFACATLECVARLTPTPHPITSQHTALHQPTSTRLARSSSTMHRPTNESGSKGLTKKQLLLVALGGAVGLFALTTTTTPLFSTPSAPSTGRSLRRRQLSHATVSLRITRP